MKKERAKSQPKPGPDLSTTLAGIPFKNPITAASGTFGYGDEMSKWVDLDRIGGVFTKGLSLYPVSGNPMPRIAETPSGMLNSIGLQNIGLKAFVEHKLPILRKFDTRVIVNFWGKTIDEYTELAERLDGTKGVDGLEMNVSCPNIKEGGMQFGNDRILLSKVIRSVREKTRLPLIVKLSPNSGNVPEFAKTSEGEGADALSVINTLVGMSVDVRTRKPRIATVTGGLSGPAIRPIALAMVHSCVRAVRIPVFGVGGILTVQDVLEFLIVGASAVQIGTATFTRPAACQELVQGLLEYCLEQKISGLKEIVNTLETGDVKVPDNTCKLG